MSHPPSSRKTNHSNICCKVLSPSRSRWTRRPFIFWTTLLVVIRWTARIAKQVWRSTRTATSRCSLHRRCRSLTRTRSLRIMTFWGSRVWIRRTRMGRRSGRSSPPTRWESRRRRLCRRSRSHWRVRNRLNPSLIGICSGSLTTSITAKASTYRTSCQATQQLFHPPVGPIYWVTGKGMMLVRLWSLGITKLTIINIIWRSRSYRSGSKVDGMQLETIGTLSSWASRTWMIQWLRKDRRCPIPSMSSLIGPSWTRPWRSIQICWNGSRGVCTPKISCRSSERVHYRNDSMIEPARLRRSNGTKVLRCRRELLSWVHVEKCTSLL